MIINKRILLFFEIFLLILIGNFTSGMINNSDGCFIYSMIFSMVLFILLLQLGGSLFQSNMELSIFILSYFLKIGYLVIMLSKMDMQNPNLSNDAEGFWNVAVIFSKGNWDYSTYGGLFTKWLAILILLFGKNIFNLLILNVFMSSMMIFGVLKVLSIIPFNKMERIIAITIVSLAPYLIIVSTNLWRENAYLMFITWAFYFFILHIQQDKLRYLLISVSLMIPVLAMHIGYFPIVVIFFVGSFRMTTHNTVNGIISLFLELLGVFCVIIVTINMSTINYVVGGNDLSIQSVMTRLGGDLDTSTVSAGSSYLLNIRANSIKDLILYTPLKVFFYLFSPLPHKWRGITDVLIFLFDSSIQIMTLIYGIKAIRCYRYSHFSTDEKWIIDYGLIIVLTCAFIFGWGTYNSGTALRHRSALIGIESIILAVSLYIKRKYYEETYEQ